MSIRLRSTAVWVAAAAAALGAASADAKGNTISGKTANGVSWTAASKIIGVTPTSTIPTGGDPRYLASGSFYRGVVGLVMEYANGDAFVCSGSLLNDRRSVLTAGHCVSGGYGTEGPSKVTAFFYDGNSADPQYYQNYLFGAAAPGVTQVATSNVFVNKGYTGEVVDQNDISVVRLATKAPSFANSYGLYAGNDLTGRTFNVAGYGSRSSGGGYVGDDLSPGRLRQGDNRYEFRLGDSDLNGFFQNPDPGDPACQPGDNLFCGSAKLDYSYVSDFDNGLLRNDTGCLTAVFAAGASISDKFCDTGLGAGEVSVGGGDSGGPQFIDGMISSVTSYGLSFGAFYGASDNDLNSTFGEFNGFVPVSIHHDFIMAAMAVPEPSSWAMLVGGVGVMGGMLRRRKRPSVSYS